MVFIIIPYFIIFISIPQIFSSRFYLPVSMVIINDIWAYIFGKRFQFLQKNCSIIHHARHLVKLVTEAFPFECSSLVSSIGEWNDFS